MSLVSHGFPDWYRLAGRADEIFVDVVNNDMDAQVQHGPFFVGAHQGLQMRFEATTNHFIIILRYFDQPGGTALGSQYVNVRAGSVFGGGFPIIGPYVTLTVSPVAINSAAIYSLWSAQTASLAQGDAAISNLLIAASNVAIGAGASRTDNPLRVWYGEATWSVFASAVVWAANLQTISPNGIITLIDRVTDTRNGERRTVFLPSSNVQIVTTNFDAAPKNFYITLGARPVWPGA